MKKRLICLMMTAVIFAAFPIFSMAASATGQGTKYGPGGPAAISAAVSPGQESGPDTGTNAKCITDGSGKTYYIFDGRKYIVESYWGQHYLTGFSAGETGSRKTASGAEVRQDYTAASTRANLGKVILVKAVSGGQTDRNISRYDGIYKCQDTGGTPVEYGNDNTGNVPVVDLYFESLADAYGVTANGWITADIYILKEIE